MDVLADFKVVIDQPVAWGDMDAFGHVNNVVYFRYFENARLEYLRRLDWLAVKDATGVGPILSATQARFRRAIKYPDAIATGAKLLDLQDDRFTIEHQIVSRELNDVCTLGQATIVSYHYGEGRKAPLPGVVKERLRALEEGVA
jgi:acyl-CoA thioester hydrolase